MEGIETLPVLDVERGMIPDEPMVECGSRVCLALWLPCRENTKGGERCLRREGEGVW